MNSSQPAGYIHHVRRHLDGRVEFTISGYPDIDHHVTLPPSAPARNAAVCRVCGAMAVDMTYHLDWHVHNGDDVDSYDRAG